MLGAATTAQARDDGFHGWDAPRSRVEWTMRVTNRNIRWPRQLMERVDKVAADLNVVLIVFAVGLATLDFTFMVTQKVIDRLPQVTRIADDASPNVVATPPAEHK